MEINIIEVLAQHGGTLALALFAIWMLERNHRQRVGELEAERQRESEEREQLLDVVKRNTEAWSMATETMSAMTDAVCENQRDLGRMRVLLARKPCIGTDALDQRTAEPRP